MPRSRLATATSNGPIPICPAATSSTGWPSATRRWGSKYDRRHACIGDGRRLRRRQGDCPGAGRCRHRRHHLRRGARLRCKRWPSERIHGIVADVTDEAVDGRALREGRSRARAVRHRRGQCRHVRQRTGAPDHARRLATHARRQPDRRIPDREAGAGRHGRAEERPHRLRRLHRRPQGLRLCRALCRGQARRRSA